MLAVAAGALILPAPAQQENLVDLVLVVVEMAALVLHMQAHQAPPIQVVGVAVVDGIQVDQTVLVLQVVLVAQESSSFEQFLVQMPI
jgi:hypothetical protein